MKNKRWIEYANMLLSQTLGLKGFEAKVLLVTAEVHPTDHKYVPSKDHIGTCEVCHWIDPQTQTDCPCRGTLRDHIVTLPGEIRLGMAIAMLVESSRILELSMLELEFYALTGMLPPRRWRTRTF